MQIVGGPGIPILLHMSAVHLWGPKMFVAESIEPKGIYWRMNKKRKIETFNNGRRKNIILVIESNICIYCFDQINLDFIDTRINKSVVYLLCSII